MSTSTFSNSKISSQVNGYSQKTPYLNPTPSQSMQNIKYFLESYKSSQAKEIFSEKFTNSGLYCENSQIPESFYKLQKHFNRHYDFFLTLVN